MAYCRISNDGKWRDVEVFRGSGALADYSTMAYRSLQTQVDRGNLFHEVAFQHAWSLVESSFLRARLVRRVYFNCMSWHLLWWSGDNWSGYLQGHGARPHHWHRWCENLNSKEGEETLYKHKKKHLAVVCNCSSIKCPNSLHSLCQVCGVVCSEIEGGTRRMLYGILTRYTESGGKSQMFIYTAFFMSMASKLETIFVSDCLAATAAARTWGWRKRHWWIWWAHQNSCNNMRSELSNQSHHCFIFSYSLDSWKSHFPPHWRSLWRRWTISHHLLRAGNISSYQAEPINKCNKSLRLESTGRAKSCCCCCLCSCSRSSACMIRCCSWALRKEIRRLCEDGVPMFAFNPHCTTDCTSGIFVKLIWSCYFGSLLSGFNAARTN